METRLDEYMTAQEVADHYRLPLQTIYGWRYKGTGPKAIKLGRHLRYRRSDVERWAEEQADGVRS